MAALACNEVPSGVKMGDEKNTRHRPLEAGLQDSQKGRLFYGNIALVGVLVDQVLKKRE